MAIEFNIQTDDGTVANANSYASVTEFKQYWENRGISFSQDETTLQSWLINAWSYEDARWPYDGTPLNYPEQSTEWPRVGAYDCYGCEVEGIPTAIKQAQFEYAKIYGDTSSLWLEGSSDIDNLIGRVTKEKVGPLEVQYQGGIGAQGETFGNWPSADRIIQNECWTSAARPHRVWRI